MPEAKPPLFPDNPHFWFETLRVIAADEYGGSLVGEVLAVAGRIKPGDYESWQEAWNAVADRVAGEADDQLRRGHKVSARDGYPARLQLLSLVRVLPPRKPARSAHRPRLPAKRGLLQRPAPRCSIRRSSRSKSPTRARRFRATSTARPLVQPAHDRRYAQRVRRLCRRDAFPGRPGGGRTRLERARVRRSGAVRAAASRRPDLPSRLGDGGDAGRRLRPQAAGS